MPDAVKQSVPPGRRRVLILIEREVGYRLSVLRGIFRYVRGAEHWLCQGSDASEHAMRIIRDWRPDGVIGALWNRSFARRLLSEKIPVVDIFDWHQELQCLRVKVDDEAVGEKAAAYLMDRGFRQLGFFGHAGLKFSVDRRTGFVRRAEADGVQVITAPPASGEGEVWTLQRQGTARQALLEWIPKLPKPIAVFCANDGYGAQLIEACHALDISVPDEVAALGADNDELLCHLWHPPLSSIELAADRVGYRAAEVLEELMRGTYSGAQRIVLPPGEIVERQSTNVLNIADPDIAAAIRYIHDNAQHPIRIEDVANHVAMTTRTLQRRFQQTVGRSLLQEIIRVRLERGRRLLAQTDLSIPQVARRCGFASRERFWSIFSKYEGCSPHEYRRRHSGIAAGA
jgi:LacI family transcriptional regulator